MSLTAAALKMLADKGFTAHEIAALAEANTVEKPRSKAAERQERYRQRKAASVTSDVTSDVTGDVTPPLKDKSKPPSSEANASGSGAADPLKEMFDLGVALLTATGITEKQARSLLGKWRKSKGEAAVIQALIDARAKAVSNPVEWLEGRFKVAKWVSSSGYEYRGSDQDVMREAERRNDMNTYWSVKTHLANRDPPKPKERFSTPPVVRQALAAARSGNA